MFVLSVLLEYTNRGTDHSDSAVVYIVVYCFVCNM